MGEADGIRKRLKESLTAAIKAQDGCAAAALRSALSAIANAEAVEPVPSKVRIGLGAGDVPRRELSDDEVIVILRREVEERRQAASQYDQLGQAEAAERLWTEAESLNRLLAS